MQYIQHTTLHCHFIVKLCTTTTTTTLHYTTLGTLYYTTLHHKTISCVTLRYSYNDATLDYTSLHYPTLHYTTFITPLRMQLQLTTLIALHHSRNSIPLQLQLHYTALHPAVVGEVTNQVTMATSVTSLKNTTPTTLQSISGFPLTSVVHKNQILQWVSYSEASATALCSTTSTHY